MLPNLPIDAAHTLEYILFSAALALLRRQAKEEYEDAVTAACHDIVIDTLCDGDMTQIINARNNTDIREQLTIEEIEALQEESRLRSQRNRN